MYLVTGATGNVGSFLTTLLDEAGHDVRVLVRDPRRAANLPSHVEVAVGDLDDAEAVRAAVRGVDGVFHMQASHASRQTEIVIDAARRADVRRIVALSSIGARLEPQPIMGTWFAAREDLLRRSGLDVTYLRPNTLMTNALWWAADIREHGRVVDPCGPGRMACVDTADIARVAAVALTEPGHEGNGYILTGPEALTTREQVAIIADVIGRPIEFEDTTPDEAAAASVAQGATPEAAEAMRDLNELFRSSRSGVVTDDVFNVTRQQPRTFRAWCEDHADAFEA